MIRLRKRCTLLSAWLLRSDLKYANSIPAGDEIKKRRHKSKHHKRGKNKKEKRSRRDQDREHSDTALNQAEAVDLPDTDMNEPHFSP